MPSGVVTFLFTDVEGSTRLWAADSDAMSASLQVHDTIVRESVEARGGVVFTTAGDSFAVAFERPDEALDAAIAAQRDLDSVEWPGPALKVRMGIHRGEAEQRGGDYFGPVVNTCARVESAGHGGQILITDAVRSVARIDDARDLGFQQLRDLAEPTRLFQVGEGEFAGLRGIVDAADTLPALRSRLLGRDEETGRLASLLEAGRLVTVVGPGGIGKTSVALETAGRLARNFAGGVHFVDLAVVTEPEDIEPAFCRGAHIPLSAATSPYEQLASFLRAGETLLVVDNCEHVIDEVADLIDRLLSQVTSVRVLATSREHLDIAGEQVLRLGPLPSNVGSTAVRLFVERAAAVRPDLAPDTVDLERISRICTRLDGVPLAIELAAARALAMSLDELDKALGDRFSLLGGGRRGRLRRQQTLRTALDWSIALLETDEARLLARLAVYVNGFDLRGAAAVGEVTPARAADIIGSLVAKSLVQRIDDTDGRARYRLLETVREWGLETLGLEGDLERVRELHAFRFRDEFAALDPVDLLRAPFARDADTADIALAITHLLDDDPEGAALIAGAHSHRLTYAGHGQLALAATSASRTNAVPELAARLWWGHTCTQIFLLAGPYEPAPPDDGSADWRFLVGGETADYAGLGGFFLAWASPEAVVTGVRALAEPGPDRDVALLRVDGMRNACDACFHLGHFEEAISLVVEAERVEDADHDSIASVPSPNTSPTNLRSVTASTAYLTALTATLVLESDLGVMAGLIKSTNLANTATRRIAIALNGVPPSERQHAIAEHATRTVSRQLPGEESIFLALMALFAIREGDVERANYLNESVAMRAPSTFALKRHNSIRIHDLPEALISDERHHRKFLAIESGRVHDHHLNRRKMLEEAARLIG